MPTVYIRISNISLRPLKVGATIIPSMDEIVIVNKPPFELKFSEIKTRKRRRKVRRDKRAARGRR